MPAPALAVEMVSSSSSDKVSRERDYVDKRREYAGIGIAEYWIVDASANTVLVLTLQGTVYAESRFVANQKIVSIAFPSLDLTAQQILSAEI